VDFKNSGKTQTAENRLKFREFFKWCVIIVDVYEEKRQKPKLK
jgi:hypothetical protein